MSTGRAHAAVGFAVVVVTAAVVPVAAQSAACADLSPAHEQVFRAALETITPLVVKIETVGGALPVEDGRAGADDRAALRFRPADGPTTGLIWSNDGYIITSSFSFMHDPAIITATLHDGRRFIAKLVARDYLARLALVKIAATDLPQPAWVESEHLRPGQWALAAGFGHGSEAPALAVGVVSALARLGGLCVQTDAKISPAHYGGPLFDIEGRVIGVCVPMGPNPDDAVAGVTWYDSGIGFAVGADVIRARVARLMAGADLQRGVMGVILEDREPVVGAQQGVQTTASEVAGVRILAAPRGPAAEVGLEAGDVITHVDGVSTPRLRDFRRFSLTKAAGDSVAVTYRRGEQTTSVTLKLVRPEELARAPATQPQ